MTYLHTKALRIHADLPVVDGHNDLPWKLHTEADGDLDRADPRGPLPDYHTDVPRMLAGGVGGQFWSVYVPASIDHPHEMTLRQIDLVERMTARDDRLAQARSADDVRRAMAAGRIGGLLGAEGGHCIENSLEKLNALAERGVRYMTLTHSDNTSWADSATDEPQFGGLTDFGRQVVREMNRLGMLVDISHVAPSTMRDALEVSTAPIIASHSNALALAPHPRNVPDDVLAELGKRGGVVMAVFFPGFVVPSTAVAMRDMFAEWRRLRIELGGDEEAVASEIERIESELDLDRGSVSNVVDHIEYIAEVAGIDGVGLGSDFDGVSMMPDGLENVSCYPAITEELLRREWTEGDIRKVLGENSLRVLAEAEAVAG